MKIGNLYIGDIMLIKNIDVTSGENYGYNVCAEFSFVRRTVVAKIKSKYSFKHEVKDVIYGGKYEVIKPTDGEVGQEFAKNLNQSKLLDAIKESGYTKTNISKRKLLKIVTSKDLLNKMN